MTEIASETPAAARHPAQDAPDETARYMGRLEEHLAGLSPSERLPRLLELRTWWLAEFDRWCDRIDRDVATITDLQCNATDFRMTVDAVSTRCAQEQARNAVIPTELPAWSQDGFTPPEEATS